MKNIIKYSLVLFILFFSISLFSLDVYLGTGTQLNGGVYFSPVGHVNNLHLSFGFINDLFLHELISVENDLFIGYSFFYYSVTPVDEKHYGFSISNYSYLNVNTGTGLINIFIAPLGLKFGLIVNHPVINDYSNKEVDIIFTPGFSCRLGLNMFLLNKKIIISPIYINVDLLPSIYTSRGEFHLLILFGGGVSIKFKIYNNKIKNENTDENI